MKITVKSLVLFMLVCIGAGLLATSAMGQVAGSSLLGQVKDTGGGAIASATVEVASAMTGSKRTVQTGADGSFTVTELQPGSYKVTVSQSGFGSQTTELSLVVGQSVTLTFTLSPASQKETVTVSGVVPLIETNSAVVHKTIDSEQVSSLPLNGRDFSTLAALIPGVTTGNTAINKNYDPVKRNVPAISINGQSGRNVYMTIDGGDNTDIFMGGQNITVSLEAVQEFEVITHDPKAQYGRGIGGVVNVVTKSGTNTYHGSGFGFFEGRRLQSQDFFSKRAGKPQPTFSSKQFGGTLGGPVLPVLKDRLFFFYSFERQIKSLSRVFNSGGAFPSLDGVSTSQPFRQNLNLAKLDWRASAKHAFLLRYAEHDNSSRNEFFSDFDAPDSTADEINRFHDALLGWNWILAPNRVNNFRFHYQYFFNAIQNRVSSLIQPTVILPAATFGASQAGTQAPKEVTFQWSDDVSWVQGRHSLRFGADIVYRPRIGIEVDFRHNRYRFANNDYNPATNTIGPTNKLLNYRSFSSPEANIVNKPLTATGFYFQDDIRLGRMTITAGLRYDYWHNLLYNRGTLAEKIVRDNVGQVPGGPKNRLPSDDKGNIAPRIGFAFDIFGNGRAVVRGGYARIFDPSAILASTLFADLEVTQFNGNAPFNFDFVPGAFARFFPGLSCATTPCQPAVFDAGTLPFSFPIGFVNSPDIDVAHADQFNGGIAYQFQEGRFAGLTLSADVIYSRTRKLLQGRNLNFCINADPACLSGNFTPTGVNFPQAGPNDPITNIPRQIFLEDSTGRNNYIAGTFTAQRRFANRWQLLASYTISQATSDTNQFTFVVLNQLKPNGPGELGPTNLDERHRVVTSGTVILPLKLEYSTIFTYASARAYTAASNGDANNDGVPTVFGAIDNGPGGSRTQNTASGDRVGPRGGLRGDSTISWDMRLSRSFSLERVLRRGSIQFLAEVFNITNRANFGQNFFDNVDDPTRFRTPIALISPPRTGQLGARIRF